MGRIDDGRRRRLCLALTVLCGSVAVLTAQWWFRGPPIASTLQARSDASLQVDVAPNPVEPGPCELLLGSKHRWTDDIEVLSGSAELVLGEIEALGPNARRISGEVLPGTSRVQIVVRRGTEETWIPIAVSEPAEPLALAANLPEEALASATLETSSPEFVYSFMPAPGVDLVSLSIVNEATGDRLLREQPFPTPAKHEESELVDADTDGDKVLDVDEPEPPVAAPDFVGLILVPGPNPLKIATTDRRGKTRLESITVTYVP